MAGLESREMCSYRIKVTEGVFRCRCTGKTGKAREICNPSDMNSNSCAEKGVSIGMYERFTWRNKRDKTGNRSSKSEIVLDTEVNMAKKGNRQFVLMTSKEDPKTRYTTKVNTMNLQTKQGQAFKLKLKKYSPTLRKHVEYTQTKIK